MLTSKNQRTIKNSRVLGAWKELLGDSMRGNIQGSFLLGEFLLILILRFGYDIYKQKDAYWRWAVREGIYKNLFIGDFRFRMN